MERIFYLLLEGMASLFEQYDQARHDDGHPELSSNVAVAPQYGTGLGKRFEEIEPQSNEVGNHLLIPTLLYHENSESYGVKFSVCHQNKYVLSRHSHSIPLY